MQKNNSSWNHFLTIIKVGHLSFLFKQTKFNFFKIPLCISFIIIRIQRQKSSTLIKLTLIFQLYCLNLQIFRLLLRALIFVKEISQKIPSLHPLPVLIFLTLSERLCLPGRFLQRLKLISTIRINF